MPIAAYPLLLLFFLLGGFFLYLLLLAFWGIKVRPTSSEPPAYRFKLLIAAHNEEHSLDGLMQSIKNANYPKELIQTQFIADHCDDATVEVIRGQGFEVIDRQQGARGKSASIAEAMNKLIPDLDEEKDVVLIFDADNLIDREFFNEMAKALANGAEVVQGNTGIHNRYASLFTKLNHVNFAVTNRFKELARSQAGLTCRLRGHGMAFRPSLIKQLNWQAGTLVEDQEMVLQLVLKDQRVRWAHRAEVNSVIPDSPKAAAAQRKRWAGGKSELTKNATRVLFDKARTDKSPIAFDLMMDYIMPSYAIQLGLIMLSTLAAWFFLGNENCLTHGFILLTVAFLSYYFIASLLEKVPVLVFATFLLSPFFIFWRVWIFISSLRGAKSWD
ncbi:MAG: glycosyltransferase family 2 protein [Gammaproteobacteria bacterium]|nr:glycosyltransferase family 2 protein [Gammaproteobacteria bacterium]